MLDHLPAHWPPPIKNTSTPPRRYAISTTIVILPSGDGGTPSRFGVVEQPTHGIRRGDKGSG
jgi:hypothetical protein